MNILLVDADRKNRNLMKEIIRGAECGWEVIGEAENAGSALSILEEHTNVNLLIADIGRLEMDGIDFVKKIRESHVSVKVIVVSEMSDYNSVRDAFCNGVTDYLLKPINRGELLVQIQHAQDCVLKDAAEALNQQRKRNLFVASVMQQLLYGKGQLEKKDVQILDELGINTKFPCYFSLIVRADRYFAQYQDTAQCERKLERDTAVILRGLEGKNNFDYCFYINGQEIILLLFCDSNEQGEEIASLLFEALNENSGEMNTDSLGISNVHHELEEMRIACREAEDAIQARFYLGPNKCVRYRDIKEKYIEIQYNLEPIVKQLVHYMELCDYIKSKQIMEQLFLDLSYSKPDKFRKCLHTLMEMLIVRIKNLDNALLSLAPDYQFQLDYLNTYRELKSYMNSILQGIIEFIKGEREKRSKKRIELAKIYIEENCQNKITLNDVAEYVELNTSYFSNLFKAEVGMNFTDYLLNIRVEKAKILLKDPKIKVYEIGNLVGYDDAVSFGRAFKKKLGMSPKEYRNTVY